MVAIEENEPSWYRVLLYWLEENGVKLEGLPIKSRIDKYNGQELYCTRDLTQKEELLTIEPSVMINQLTIKKHTNCPIDVFNNLTATQLISLVIGVNMRPEQENQDELYKTFGMSTFKPYFASLPTSFDTVPLWIEQSSTTDHATKDAYLALEECFTPTLQEKIDDVRKRFENDLKHVCDVLAKSKFTENTEIETGTEAGTKSLDLVAKQDFLLGWLIVNTRCFSYNVNAEDKKDNITMAPFIDFANHDPKSTAIVQDREHCLVMFSSAPTKFEKPKVGKKVLYKFNKPVTFSYGGHSDEVLLAEYGFCLGKENNPFNSIDVTKQIQSLFDKEVKEQLDTYGYGSDYALEEVDIGEFNGTYNLIMALRLFHSKSDKEKKRWEQTHSGLLEIISESNEKLVEKTIQETCQIVRERSARGLDRTMNLLNSFKANNWDEHSPIMIVANCVRVLWNDCLLE